MNTTTKEKIRFSKAFWVANTVELFERAAYYGVFIVITLYLSRILGFNDIQAAGIAGVFSACLYLFPTFAGALADKIGFRNSMLIAFSLLTFGYLDLATVCRISAIWNDHHFYRTVGKQPAIWNHPDHDPDRMRWCFHQKRDFRYSSQRDDP